MLLSGTLPKFQVVKILDMPLFFFKKNTVAGLNKTIFNVLCVKSSSLCHHPCYEKKYMLVAYLYYIKVYVTTPTILL